MFHLELSKMTCPRCEGKTLDNTRCRRKASCRIQCINFCWQHAENYKNKSVGCRAKATARKTSVAKKTSNTVHFQKGPPQTKHIKLNEHEKNEKTKVWRDIQNAEEKLRQIDYRCIEYVLGRMNVWDEGDVMNLKNEQDRHIATTCLRIVNGKSVSTKDRSLINQIARKMIKQSEEYRQLRMK